MKQAEDLTGKQFGELTVLYRDYNEEAKHPNRGSTYWKCKCSCGKEKSILKGSLVSGATKSCGCLRRKISSQRLSKISSDNYINELGNKYGKLTVVQKIPNVKNNRNGVMWRCICECGNIKDVLGVDLRAGNVTSCGCIGKSKGEYYIEKILIQNNIPFVKEFPQDINGHLMRYDFAILENNKISYLIEFDGEQHFHSVKHFGGEEYFNYIKENDNLKNNWCKKHNIPLIRIPYTHINKIQLIDLIPRTTKFLYN